MAPANSRNNPARTRWIRILAVFRSVMMIVMDKYERNNQACDTKTGGVCVTVGTRCLRRTEKRKAGGGEKQHHLMSTGTTCYLGSSDCLSYKVGSDEAVSDRLAFCFFTSWGGYLQFEWLRVYTRVLDSFQLQMQVSIYRWRSCTPYPMLTSR